jgi:penicillin-binding protein 2
MVSLDNGKKIILPREKVEFEKLDINPWHIDAVMQGMDDVVNKPYGGSHRVKLEEKFAMAGKTGTAQVRSNRRWKHVPKNRADRYHALYIGYAPVHKPKYAVSVVVEHGGYGSVAAAPLGSAILLKVQQMAEEKS